MPDNMTVGLIKPRLDYNYVLNPSAEIADNYVAVGGATVARSTTYQKYGLYSYSVLTPSSSDGLQLTTYALTNAPQFFVARIRFMTQISLQFRLGSTTKNATLLEKIDNDWYLYGAFFSAAEANGATSVRIIRTGAAKPGTNGFYADGVHVGPMGVNVGTYSTYVDGDQEGSLWLGAPHASISYRSADSLAGGVVVDLFKQYGFFATRIVGAGAVTPELAIDSYAQLPGGEINSEKIPSRTFSIVGKFYGNNEEDLHDKQQALELALDANAYPGNQQMKMRFFKAAAQKEIAAMYSGGLEGDLPVYYNDMEPGDKEWTKTYRYIMPASLQFTAAWPFFNEVGESAITLDVKDTSTFKYVAGRIISGATTWSLMDSPATGGGINAIAENDTYVYIGGNFADWTSGLAGDAYIVAYNKQTGEYESLGSGLNGIVNAIAIAPNGDVWIGGQFTNAGGVAAADYLTRWDGVNFNAVGTPLTGAASITLVSSICFDANGNVYIGGVFLQWNNNANANNIVMWNGSAYVALSGGMASVPSANSIVLDRNGTTIYIGTTAAGDGVKVWNGSAFSTTNGTFNGTVNALAVRPSDGVLFAAGGFTTPQTRVGYYDSGVWHPLGSGATGGAVTNLAFGRDGLLYLAGEATAYGDLSVTNGRAARWNGYSYARLDFLPGIDIARILPSYYSVDPIVQQNYTIWAGFGGEATNAQYAGLTSVRNEGTAWAFPKIIISRSGGTTAVIQSIRNERTGRQLYLDYSLLDGEVLTIDLNPKNRKVTSNFFEGDRFEAVLPNSDLSIWQLLPGDQGVSVLVSDTGSPTVTAYLLWRDSYKSWN